MREKTVEDMLHQPQHERVAYWLQLVLSVGIATFGLVLGSTAVVIGAMLVSPLMSPIVELGVGLATGSPFLVLRSGSRALLSVLTVVGGSAIIAMLIPFHEVNAEIHARTMPNVLDLLIAACCALAGVYTTVRKGDSSVAAAAGTAIGISLVPPLCVAGYGIGTWNQPVARGAALLFTANFSAIVLVATFSLLVVGFSRVGITRLERLELDSEDHGDRLARRAARALQGAFESRFGPMLRVAMPVLIIGAVYLPLRDALEEVTWQVRVRTEVQAMLDAMPEEVVQSALILDHHHVVLRLVLIGSAEDADRVRESIDDEVRRLSGVVPTIEAIALPDAEALRQLQVSVHSIQSAGAPITPVDVPRAPPVPQTLRASLDASWPASAGVLIESDFAPQEEGLLVRVTHGGPQLGPIVRDLLARDLARVLECEVVVEERAMRLGEVALAEGGELEFFGALSRAVEDAQTFPRLSVCATTTAAPPLAPGSAALPVPADEALRRSMASLTRGRTRLSVREGDAFAFTIQLDDESCSPPTEAAPAEQEESAP